MKISMNKIDFFFPCLSDQTWYNFIYSTYWNFSNYKTAAVQIVKFIFYILLIQNVRYNLSILSWFSCLKKIMVNRFDKSTFCKSIIHYYRMQIYNICPGWIQDLTPYSLPMCLPLSVSVKMLLCQTRHLLHTLTEFQT